MYANILSPGFFTIIIIIIIIITKSSVILAVATGSLVLTRGDVATAVVDKTAVQTDTVTVSQPTSTAEAVATSVSLSHVTDELRIKLVVPLLIILNKHRANRGANLNPSTCVACLSARTDPPVLW